jgi:hypothetical protein
MEKPELVLDSRNIEHVIPQKVISSDIQPKRVIPSKIARIPGRSDLYTKIEDMKNPASNLYRKEETEPINNLYRYKSIPYTLPKLPDIPITSDTVEETLNVILLTLIGASLFVPMYKIGGKTQKKKR